MTQADHSSIDPELFGRVLAGGGSAEERSAVREFLRARPEADVLARLARQTDDNEIGVAAREAGRERLAAYLGIPRGALGFWGNGSQDDAPAKRSDSTSPEGVRRLKDRNVGRRQTLKERFFQPLVWTVGVAGAFALMVVAAHPGMHVAREAPRIYRTEANRQAVVTLNDGTRIHLAPRTVIRIEHPNSSARAVVLDEGEAYFTVIQKTTEPFVVRSGDVTTTVLGTDFLVQHAGSGSTRVAVASGRVRVQPARAFARTLGAGDVGTVRDSTLVVGHVQHLDSKRGLAFTDVPVKDVLTTLTQWYGYAFRCGDSTVARQNVTLWLSTQSSAEALTTLKRILDVSLTVKGDTITLVPHRTAGGRSAPRVKDYDVWTPTREVGR